MASNTKVMAREIFPRSRPRITPGVSSYSNAEISSTVKTMRPLLLLKIADRIATTAVIKRSVRSEKRNGGLSAKVDTSASGLNSSEIVLTPNNAFNVSTHSLIRDVDALFRRVRLLHVVLPMPVVAVVR
ncbi:MAG: hypothetical protein IH831_06775 [Planctomycetes bacterium]|nr:hypothetical protein [Planctomycetota bacterium]